LLLHDDCHSEKTEFVFCHSENAGLLVVDTLYARVTVGTSSMRPCAGPCAICDVIVKYRIPLYASKVSSISIYLLEAGLVSTVHSDFFGYFPPDDQYQDSVLCAFPLRTEGLEEAHLQLLFAGTYYNVVGEGDTMRHECCGNIRYCDTLVVRTQRIQ
jgi:hypothetical protein